MDPVQAAYTETHSNSWTWGSCITYATRNGATAQDARDFAIWAHDLDFGDIRWQLNETVDVAFARWGAETFADRATKVASS